MNRAKAITAAALGLAVVAAVLVVVVLRSRLGDDGAGDRKAAERAALAAQAEQAAANMRAVEAARQARAARIARGPGRFSLEDVTEQLLGQQRVTSGPALDGLRLGMAAPVPTAVDERLRLFVEERGGSVEFALQQHLEQVTISGPLDDGASELIGVTMALRWGAPRVNLDGDQVWLDDALGGRISLQRDRARFELRYQQHLSAAVLVAPDLPGSLGFEPANGLIGRAISDVVQELGAPLTPGPLPGQPGGANARPVEWIRPSFGVARAPARLRLEATSTGLVQRASYVDSEAACGDLRELLVRKHGKAIWVADDRSAYTWEMTDRSVNLLCTIDGATELTVVGR